ncbi:hypothetical protein [Salinibacter ruber]|uniref:hypothetical protein n=1 Tax=Salinibacter ruber TaxID=146919 RepID=UPI002166FBA9|nr:hypothetical protein [Salinibacter ruber]MCS3699230.1 hypothetical protein [Salinibacter ruber]MCS4096983.1 hypothetical protein [Salinibacter ruber]
MFEVSSVFYLHVALWAVGLHGVWEYAQVIPLYRCWGRWTRWQRIWVLPAATLGDAVATVAFTAGTAAALGPAHVQPLTLAGAAMLLGVGLAAGLVFETVARALDLWRYETSMPTLRVAGHRIGAVPVLQMTILPTLAVALAT